MSKDNTLVSIIVPVYGTESYLPACIESICSQTHKNLQIILVDDQSPDKCPEICDAYARKDSRIKVIHQKNKGVSGARNSGLHMATGVYVMFLDSDDILYPDAVETLLRDANDHGADIVSATKKVVDDKKGIVKSDEDGSIYVYRNEEPLILSLNGERNTNSACAKLFKTSFIQGVDFEEGKNVNEDGFFVFLCYLRQPVLVQHNVDVYQYNVHENSGSRAVFSDKYLDMLYFCERKKELIAAQCPQYMDLSHNMEVRTNLLFLDVLCKTTDKKYRAVQRQCVNTVRRLFRCHKPINDHHRKQALIVKLGLYPLYKAAVRIKYRR